MNTYTDRSEPDADHEFKNFHRALCERFEYVHDEKDWKRDQVSLIEWIAGRVSGEPDGGAGDVHISKVWASGGTTGWCDYLMTDNSIRTLKVSAVTPGQEFPPNNGEFQTVTAPATAAHAGATLTDAQIDSIWLYRSSIHNGELMPQLRDFARAVLAAGGMTPVGKVVYGEIYGWHLQLEGATWDALKGQTLYAIGTPPAGSTGEPK